MASRDKRDFSDNCSKDIIRQIGDIQSLAVDFADIDFFSSESSKRWLADLELTAQVKAPQEQMRAMSTACNTNKTPITSVFTAAQACETKYEKQLSKVYNKREKLITALDAMVDCIDPDSRVIDVMKIKSVVLPKMQEIEAANVEFWMEQFATVDENGDFIIADDGSLKIDETNIGNFLENESGESIPATAYSVLGAIFANIDNAKQMESLLRFLLIEDTDYEGEAGIKCWNLDPVKTANILNAMNQFIINQIDTGLYILNMSDNDFATQYAQQMYQRQFQIGGIDSSKVRSADSYAQELLNDSDKLMAARKSAIEVYLGVASIPIRNSLFLEMLMNDNEFIGSSDEQGRKGPSGEAIGESGSWFHVGLDKSGGGAGTIQLSQRYMNSPESGGLYEYDKISVMDGNYGATADTWLDNLVIEKLGLSSNENPLGEAGKAVVAGKAVGLGVKAGVSLVAGVAGVATPPGWVATGITVGVNVVISVTKEVREAKKNKEAIQLLNAGNYATSFALYVVVVNKNSLESVVLYATAETRSKVAQVNDRIWGEGSNAVFKKNPALKQKVQQLAAEIFKDYGGVFTVALVVNHPELVDQFWQKMGQLMDDKGDRISLKSLRARIYGNSST